jgi:uncharacterized protein HemY
MIQAAVLDGQHQHVERHAESAVAHEGAAVVQLDMAADLAQLAGDGDRPSSRCAR